MENSDVEVVIMVILPLSVTVWCCDKFTAVRDGLMIICGQSQQCMLKCDPLQQNQP